MDIVLAFLYAITFTVLIKRRSSGIEDGALNTKLGFLFVLGLLSALRTANFMIEPFAIKDTCSRETMSTLKSAEFLPAVLKS